MARSPISTPPLKNSRRPSGVRTRMKFCRPTSAKSPRVVCNRARAARIGRPKSVTTLIEIAARTGCMDAFKHLTERTARATDLTTSLCAVLLAEACNTGPEPFVRQDTPALRRDRLLWVDQNYVRDETLTAANTLLVAAQSRIPL